MRATIASVSRLFTLVERTPLHRRGIRAFRAVVGVALLFRVITEIRYASLLWGPGGFGYGGQRRAFGDLLGGLLDRVFDYQFGPHVLLCIEGVGALCLMFGRWERVAGAVTWLCVFCLGTRLPDMLDGGDNVCTLALMFSVLLLPSRDAGAGRFAIWCHNIGVGLLWFQICLLYFTAGTMKLAGGVWRDGTALYYISNVKWFAHPWSMAIFKYALPATIAAYATMIHQIWFPIAVFTRLRLFWLVFGMAFHVAIAMFMGLITFSCFMVALELVLIDDRQYAWIGAHLTRGRERCRGWLVRHRALPARSGT
jgi:hypothetical protein